MAEPDVLICFINADLKGECYNNDNELVKTLGIMDMIGFEAVSPKDFADIKTHHEVLHRELNRKFK